MRQRRELVQVMTEEPATWLKFSRKMCGDCTAACCSLPVEVRAADLIRMDLMDPGEAGEGLRLVARRLIRSGLAGHYHHRSATLTLARMANGDCCFLDSRSRRCTIYDRRPDTCRNHPQIGPRPGYCAYTKRR